MTAVIEIRMEQSKIWRFVAIAILLLSALRGLRLPNIWSYSHFLFNYDLGFVKRGIVGEFAARAGEPLYLSYNFFVLFSFTILCINLVLLGRLLLGLVDSRVPLLIGCALVYASSIAIGLLAHTVGYFDQIGLLVTLIALLIHGFYKRMLFLGFVLPLAILVHEAIFLMFFPVILLSLWLEMDRPLARTQVLALTIFTIALLGLVWIVGGQTLDPKAALQLYERTQATVEIPLREDAFHVLGRGLSDNVQIMATRWLEGRRYLQLAASWAVSLPSAGVLLGVAVVGLRRTRAGASTVFLAILAGLAPLALHLLGWDMHRWNGLVVTCSLLTLYVVTSRLQSQELLTIPATVYPLLVFLIFLNGISTIPLFDGYEIQQFPFVEQQKILLDSLRTGELPLNPPAR